MKNPDKIRVCEKGYLCGDTCISLDKVCLKKIVSEQAKAVAKRFKDLCGNNC